MTPGVRMAGRHRVVLLKLSGDGPGCIAVGQASGRCRRAQDREGDLTQTDRARIAQLNGQDYPIRDGIALVIPAGTRHNIIHKGKDAP